MTPFVNVALLLIVFFVWVKMVQRPNQVPIAFPDFSKTFCGEYPVADASLFLMANNRIGYLTYKQQSEKADFIETNYSSKGIRRLLMRSAVTAHNSRFIVMIRPTNFSILGNLVSSIDEIRRFTNIHFTIIPLTRSEDYFLRQYQKIKEQQGDLPIVKKIRLEPQWYKGG